MTFVICECGCTVHKSGLARHKRTIKHQNIMINDVVPVVVNVPAPAVEVVDNDVIKLIKDQDNNIKILHEIIKMQAERIKKLEDVIFKPVEPVEVVEVVEPVEDDEVDNLSTSSKDDDESSDDEDDEDVEEFEKDQDDIDDEEEQQEYEYEYNEMAEAWYKKTLRMDYKGDYVHNYKNQKYLQTFLYIDIHKILDKNFKEFHLNKYNNIGGNYCKKLEILYKKWDEQVVKSLDKYLEEYPIEIMPTCPQKNKK